MAHLILGAKGRMTGRTMLCQCYKKQLAFLVSTIVTA